MEDRANWTASSLENCQVSEHPAQLGSNPGSSAILKKCATCKLDKSISDFHNRYNRAHKKQSSCKDCVKEYKKSHYKNNRDKYYTKNRKYQALFRAIVNKLKDRPCVDCGNSFPPCAMDFDHVKGKKIIDIARLNHRPSLRKLLLEIAKCEVVCACCHRIRTNKRVSSKGRMQSFQVCDVSSILTTRSKCYDKESWNIVRELFGIEKMPEIVKRPRFAKMVGPEGTVWCSIHKQFLPVELFCKNAGNWNGYSRQCRDCRNKARRKPPRTNTSI